MEDPHLNRKDNESDGDGLGEESADAKKKTVPYLPPCRICGREASGFHYGVNTCEACKGFFRRSIARPTAYAPCNNAGDCDLLTGDRNSCPDCRYRKCLNSGMSKAAIKTGRYTHTKRTQDAMEIQQINYAVGGSNPSPCSPSSSAAPSAFRFPMFSPPSMQSNRVVEKMLEGICNAFRKAFPQTTYMYEHKDKVDRMTRCILAEQGVDQVTNLITYSLSCEPEKKISALKTKADVLTSIEALNSSITGDLLWELPEYKLAYRDLFSTWSTNIDKFIKNFVVFARQLPHFGRFCDDDQAVLVKAARPEVAALVKFKHMTPEIKAIINYNEETNSMVLMPQKLLSRMLVGPIQDGHLSDYHLVFRRFMMRMRSLQLQVSDIAVLCALCLLAGDREDLTDNCVHEIFLMEQQLIQCLEYSISKNPRKSGRGAKLAHYLEILPMLRDLSVFNLQAMINAQERVNPIISELLRDVLPQPTRYYQHTEQQVAMEQRSASHSPHDSLPSTSSSLPPPGYTEPGFSHPLQPNISNHAPVFPAPAAPISSFTPSVNMQSPRFCFPQTQPATHNAQIPSMTYSQADP